MSSLSLLDDAGRRVLTVTVTRVVVGAAMVLPPLVAVVVTWQVADSGSPWWPAPLLVALVPFAAALPDSGIPGLVLAGTGAWWLAAVHEPSLPATLLVAACFLVFHVATAHAAAGPPGCRPSAVVVGSLVARTGGLMAITAGVAAAAAPVDEVVGTPPVLVAAALVAVAALPWALSSSRR